MTETTANTRRDQGGRAARQALERAHDAAYRYPQDLAGFAANVSVRCDAWTFDGAVQVWSPHGVALDGRPPTHPSGESLAGAILTVVSWRFPREFAELDGRYEAAFDPELDRLGCRAVRLLGDERQTVRWLDERGLAETTFRQGECGHRLEVLDRHDLPDGRWLPAVTRETITENGTHRRDTREIVDDFVEVGSVYLPSRRIVITERDRENPPFEITFVDHALRMRRSATDQRNPKTNGRSSAR